MKRSKRVGRMVFGIALTGLLAGCVSPASMKAAVAERASWRDRAAAPVEVYEFTILRDWSFLDRDWVLLEVNRGRQLAVQVRQPCVADIREARSVRLEQRMPNQLHRQSDRLLIDGRRCIINEMRPIERMRVDSEVNGSVTI
ncbi:MAG: DUF6491 family protein [Wenzhouxiangellaceae bacterium]|nr:DUF6491 family protein [Wenzhouxiangellaceae bacterium]